MLKKFTLTGADPIAQYEKIRSAYTIADWSEDYFNNKALFSDYYLLNRLPESEAWKEDPKPIFIEFLNLYQGASSKYADKNEATLRKELFEPAFHLLGFHALPGKSAKSEEIFPDYRLYPPPGDGSSQKKDEPLALALVYAWGRSLDGKDDVRDKETPEENPGAAVISLLEKGEAPWAVVTNGKIWRLYSRRAPSRSGNYYEVDLEEILAGFGPEAPDLATAFRYFWLFFRREAFTPHISSREGETAAGALSFLDEIFEGSEAYARELGERLKERVFEEIFPYLAEGFFAYMKEMGQINEELKDEVLQDIYQGTLTLLYRLLFLLYAEARDLLPVRETRGYSQVSLARIKQEIAETAGPISDEAGVRIFKAYSKGSFSLYDRLTELFQIVDEGDPYLNVPPYNGGLFLTEPDDDEQDQETHNARFLAAVKVPDAYLARAIDLLSRDIDPKRGDLVFIDFKSLGVRHLGSIYEGLLEFKLRMAREKMAVVKGKRTEEVVPYREAIKNKAKIVKTGRGKEAKEKVIAKGSLYLENDRRERKATGSYYTPEVIVKYIVDKAVGPVLEEKFASMRPLLR